MIGPLVTESTPAGTHLRRPECVLATASGALYCSDSRGGISRIAPDGRQTVIGKETGLLPNGFALRRDGSFVVANLAGEGGVWEIAPDGTANPLLSEVDGVRLRAVNFVRLDAMGRLWITANPPVPADGRYPIATPGGFIAIQDEAGARVVADGISWANECLIDRSGRYLYVNETFGRRLTRFDLGSTGKLSNRMMVTSFGPGTYPDGLAEDKEGGIWVVSVASNRVIRVEPSGEPTVLIEDCEAGHLARLEDLYGGGRLTREELTRPTGKVLKSITSIAFGGPDLRTAYLGSLGGSTLPSFRTGVAGAEPVHWRW